MINKEAAIEPIQLQGARYKIRVPATDRIVFKNAEEKEQLVTSLQDKFATRLHAENVQVKFTIWYLELSMSISDPAYVKRIESYESLGGFLQEEVQKITKRNPKSVQAPLTKLKLNFSKINVDNTFDFKVKFTSDKADTKYQEAEKAYDTSVLRSALRDQKGAKIQEDPQEPGTFIVSINAESYSDASKDVQSLYKETREVAGLGPGQSVGQTTKTYKSVQRGSKRAVQDQEDILKKIEDCLKDLYEQFQAFPEVFTNSGDTERKITDIGVRCQSIADLTVHIARLNTNFSKTIRDAMAYLVTKHQDDLVFDTEETDEDAKEPTQKSVYNSNGNVSTRRLTSVLYQNPEFAAKLPKLLMSLGFRGPFHLDTSNGNLTEGKITSNSIRRALFISPEVQVTQNGKIPTEFNTENIQLMSGKITGTGICVDQYTTDMLRGLLKSVTSNLDTAESLTATIQKLQHLFTESGPDDDFYKTVMSEQNHSLMDVITGTYDIPNYLKHLKEEGKDTKSILDDINTKYNKFLTEDKATGSSSQALRDLADCYLEHAVATMKVQESRAGITVANTVLSTLDALSAEDSAFSASEVLKDFNKKIQEGIKSKYNDGDNSLYSILTRIHDKESAIQNLSKIKSIMQDLVDIANTNISEQERFEIIQTVYFVNNFMQKFTGIETTVLPNKLNALKKETSTAINQKTLDATEAKFTESQESLESAIQRSNTFRDDQVAALYDKIVNSEGDSSLEVALQEEQRRNFIHNKNVTTQQEIETVNDNPAEYLPNFNEKTAEQAVEYKIINKYYSGDVVDDKGHPIEKQQNTDEFRIRTSIPYTEDEWKSLQKRDPNFNDSTKYKVEYIPSKEEGKGILKLRTGYGFIRKKTEAGKVAFFMKNFIDNSSNHNDITKPYTTMHRLISNYILEKPYSKAKDLRSAHERLHGNPEDYKSIKKLCPVCKQPLCVKVSAHGWDKAIVCSRSEKHYKEELPKETDYQDFRSVSYAVAQSKTGGFLTDESGDVRTVTTLKPEYKKRSVPGDMGLILATGKIDDIAYKEKDEDSERFNNEIQTPQYEQYLNELRYSDIDNYSNELKTHQAFVDSDIQKQLNKIYQILPDAKNERDITNIRSIYDNLVREVADSIKFKNNGQKTTKEDNKQKEQNETEVLSEEAKAFKEKWEAKLNAVDALIKQKEQELGISKEVEKVTDTPTKEIVSLKQLNSILQKKYEVILNHIEGYKYDNIYDEVMHDLERKDAEMRERAKIDRTTLSLEDRLRLNSRYLSFWLDTTGAVRSVKFGLQDQIRAFQKSIIENVNKLAAKNKKHAQELLDAWKPKGDALQNQIPNVVEGIEDAIKAAQKDFAAQQEAESETENQTQPTDEQNNTDENHTVSGFRINLKKVAKRYKGFNFYKDISEE